MTSPHHLTYVREQREHYEDHAAAEREAAHDRWIGAIAALAAATAEAFEVDGISRDEAEAAAIFCEEFGLADALADVLERIDREHAAALAALTAQEKSQ